MPTLTIDQPVLDKLLQQRDQLIAELQADMQKLEAKEKAAGVMRRAKEKAIRDRYRLMNVTEAAWETILKEEHELQEAAVKQLLNGVRPKLLQPQAPPPDPTLPDNVIRNVKLAIPADVTLVASDPHIIPAPTARPATTVRTLHLGSQVKDAAVAVRGSGAGWGSGSQQTVCAVFSYAFRPDHTGVISFNFPVVLRGFHILRANDSWWTSKEAKVEVAVTTKVCQYYWQTEGWRTLLTERGDTIDHADRNDQVNFVGRSATVGALDWVGFHIVVRLYAYARGSGSYAEANCAVGAANYIQIPWVTVQ